MWEALNLLRFESFPALLVELSLLRSFDIFHADARQEISNQSRPAMQPANQQRREQAQPEPPVVQRSTEVKQEPVVPVEQSPHARQAEPKVPFQLVGDEQWSGLLANLEKNSLTTYALVRQGVKPQQEGDELLLEFEDSGAGRMAVRYVLQPEHSGKLLAAVRECYGPTRSLAVKIEGEEAVVQLSAGQEASKAPAVGSATIEVGGKGSGKEVTKPLTANDAIELFGATELKDGD